MILKFPCVRCNDFIFEIKASKNDHKQLIFCHKCNIDILLEVTEKIVILSYPDRDITFERSK